MEYRYDIRQFVWDSEKNSFYGEAPYLECMLGDGSIHPEAFPNQKSQFFIDNHKTGGFRRFRFLKEVVNTLKDEEDTEWYEVIEWIYESEDGIKCIITIN